MNGTKIVSFKHRRSQVAIDWLTLVSPSKNSLALQTLFFFTTLPSSSLLHFLSLSLSHSQVHSLRTQYFLLSPSLHAFHRRAFSVCQMSITRSHHLLSLSPSLPIYIIATPLYYSPISLSLSWIKLSLLLYLYHRKPYQTLYLFLSFTNLSLFHKSFSHSLSLISLSILDTNLSVSLFHWYLSLALSLSLVHKPFSLSVSSRWRLMEMCRAAAAAAARCTTSSVRPSAS